ncbi:MAG: 50S ribosomal protein L30e [Candidatus Woesearchaeota archaeon]|nr:MAG: 50S ribosomal protein L30e [Candidatus Woesearchaeota archaeon]
MYEEEIRKNLAAGKIIIGTDETLKNIRKGLIAKVYVASNCSEDVFKDLKKYSKISGFEILETKLPNDELGAICKKPFNIAMLGLLK